MARQPGRTPTKNENDNEDKSDGDAVDDNPEGGAQIGGSGNNVGSCNSIVGQLVVAANSSGVATT